MVIIVETLQVNHRVDDSSKNREGGAERGEGA